MCREASCRYLNPAREKQPGVEMLWMHSFQFHYNKIVIAVDVIVLPITMPNDPFVSTVNFIAIISISSAKSVRYDLKQPDQRSR